MSELKAPWHDGLKGLLKVVGPALVVVGGLLALTSIADFFQSFNAGMGGSSFGDSAMPTKFWMAFVGLPMVSFGVMLSKVAFLGEGTRYVAGEVVPVAKDSLDHLGVDLGGGERATAGTLACPSCQTANDLDARFCDGCGGSLRLRCSACGSDHDTAASFCPTCGVSVTP